LILYIIKHLAMGLAKTSPVLGCMVIFSSIESFNGGPWMEVWRVAISVAGGVFIALVGMIYQNLNRRVETLEKGSRSDFVPRKEYDIGRQNEKDRAIKDDFVPRKEYETRQQDLVERFDRFEGRFDRLEDLIRKKK
jgi:hypothetical protein